MIQIGRLNKRVDLQSPDAAIDSYGGLAPATWTTEAASVPAAIWHVGATEALKQGQMGMTMTHRIRINYRSTLKSDWRIKYQDRYFNIVNIVDYNMEHRYFDLLCKEAET